MKVSLSSAKMACCQARILGEEYTIQGTDVKCHHTRECGAAAVKKITVDDGDAFFHICAGCFRRFLTKSSKKDLWLGWFDCAYPPHAQVTHSPWYHEQVRKAWEAYNKTQDAAHEEVKELIKEMDELLRPTPSPVVKVAEKELLKKQIDELVAWFKGEGRLKFKEQPAKDKELTRLRVAYRML
jgi:hypothetical protein